MNQCSVTVAIPTYQRIEKLLITLEKILECNPQPNEIIIHVDYGDLSTAKVIKKKYPEITIITSESQMGPGGGRNKIIKIANNNLIASFDDDSYPLDRDYFSRLVTLFEQLPQAAVIGAAVFHLGESIQPEEYTSNFIGCGCGYRRDFFQQTSGYVALPLAYGMEEIDLALRLTDLDRQIIYSPWLRVLHNTHLEHHRQPQITAATIANQILLTYLRYPLTWWWLGLFQGLNRIIWSIKAHRFAGIFAGIISIPQLIVKHQGDRRAVTSKSLKKYLQSRREIITIKLN
jgi:GT2 family glycosyltransferase